MKSELNEIIIKILGKKLSNIKPISLTRVFRRKSKDILTLSIKMKKKYKSDNVNECLFLILNNINTIPRCKCGKNLQFYSINKGYSKYCSIKCSTKFSSNKAKQTKLERYGSESYCNSDKIKQTKLERYSDENFNNPDQNKRTCLKRYGVEHHNKNKHISSKIKQTKLERYGDENFNNPDQNKRTCLKRYGVEHFLKTDDGKTKLKTTNIKTFYTKLITSNRLNKLVKPLFTIDQYCGSKEKKYQWKCCKCDRVFEDYISNGIIPRCNNCFPLTHSIKSVGELEISGLLNEIGIHHTKNDRVIIHPLELDIVIPSKKIAIEFDGIYWHSEKFKDKNYHLNKTNMCNKSGYQLIHIFEDEWNEKSEIVKSIIKAKLGIFDQKIYGRKCNIKKINYKETEIFLDENHIQGPIKSKHNYGLFYKGELVAVATFSKSRFRKDNSFELLRFCSKLNTQVLGGLSKLISAWKKEYSNQTLISYADKRYSNGIGYESSGFKLIGESKPNYKYFKSGKLESRLKYQKHKLSKILENFNPELTEWENMQLNGFDRIWDCGNYIFEKSS